MQTTELPPEINEQSEKASSFEPAVAKILQSLRQSIAATLAGIGDFGKPADVYKTLQLDRTLSRQLFRLASSAEPIGNGGIIPSRTSIDRFLNAAGARGAGNQKLAAVREAYEAFEELVETHAGDRATFNSMVSAAGGVDEDWLATDLQHRRNAFRAMSHALGLQTKTRVLTFIVKCDADSGKLDVAVIGGFIGLRVLRSLPSVRAFATAGDSLHDTTKVTCSPIGLSAAGGGYVIEAFSSMPLPNLITRPGPAENGLSQEVVIEKPMVGNFGVSTLMFGTLFNGMAFNSAEPLRLHTSVNQPTERLLIDVLIAPNLRNDVTPVGQAVIGFQMGATNKFGPNMVPLEGNFDAEYLGTGPGALATLEVPSYVSMLDAIDEKLQWGIDGFKAWRLRAEFPLYQSTFTIEWPTNDR